VIGAILAAAVVALSGVHTEDLDRTADPCTDFYEFANGAWRKANPIPASKTTWSRRIAAREANRRRVQELLEEMAKRTDRPKGSAEQIAGDHYASCMDEAGIEAAGLGALARLLSEIDDIRNPGDVPRVIRRLHEVGVAVPFGVVSAPDYHEPRSTIANVVAGTLGMPDRASYLSPEPRFEDARATYRTRVARVLALGGMDEAASAAAADVVLALEKRLAEVSLDKAAADDPAATDHRTTFADLETLAPHVEWKRYFDAARLPRVDVNVAEPKQLRQVDKELTGTPVATWKAYLKFQLLESVSPSLPRAFAAAGEGRPRAARCVDSTETLFGEAVGRTYAERYFSASSKAKEREIARNLLAVLSEEVAAVEWMSPETRKTAIEKLAATDLQIGYPDTWKDTSKVVVRRDAFLANVLAGRRLGVDEDRRQIGKPTNRDLWALPPSSPGAYLDLQLDKVVLPAGFLQPPYFDPGATDAVNYGAIGIGLAHDLTHAIDAGGSEIDVMGHPRSWWSEADRKAFEERAQCVVEQYEGYFVAPGVPHQGKRVRSEAIGDLAGVRVAYRALERSMESRPVPVVDGFTPEQQFFLSWGQVTGAAMTADAQRELVATDPHPAPRYRVVGPLSSSPEFQRAFSCPAGAAMVRPPARRCAVW
jgi:endothelin-converting enzyme/putative endopeptidase